MKSIHCAARSAEGPWRSSFIEQEDQADVIERILKHCQLWNDYPARAPPKPAVASEFELEVEYVDFDQFLMGF